MNEESYAYTGAGAFIRALIPAAIVIAVVLALIAATVFVDLRHSSHAYDVLASIQKRMDGRVGVRSLPTAKVQLIILPQHGCVQIEQAFLDSGQLTVYFRSHCTKFADYYQFHLNELAPDGTVLDSTYNNTAFLPQLKPGQRGEWVQNGLDQDSRTVRIEIWTAD